MIRSNIRAGVFRCRLQRKRASPTSPTRDLLRLERIMNLLCH